jgi:hypothetical protein
LFEYDKGDHTESPSELDTTTETPYWPTHSLGCLFLRAWAAMRVACLLSLIQLTLVSGCAGMIATSGIKLDTFETMDEVHTTFGEPSATGSAKDAFKKGQNVPKEAAFYEDFRTRLKIADRDWCDGDGYAIVLIATCGTGELFLFPQQLYDLTKHTITGQTLRIIYDTRGRVLAGQLDGKDLYLRPPYFNGNEVASPPPSLQAQP